MTSVAVPGTRTLPFPPALLAAPVAVTAGPADRAGLDRELDLLVSAVRRQRPDVPENQVALQVAAVAAELAADEQAAGHPMDGSFPVLVHTLVLARLSG